MKNVFPGILFFSLICLSLSYGQQVSDTAVTHDSSSNSGTLHIASKPDSAVVVIDDVMRGNAPVTVQGMSAGDHVILLKKDGYFLKKAIVSVPADTTMELVFELTKPLERVIVSNPDGAAVILDEKTRGTTPFIVKKLKPGQHEIILSLAGYETLKDTVMLADGGQDTLKFDLVPLKPAKTVGSASSAGPSDGSKQKLVNRIAIGVFLALTLAIIIVELADTND